VQVTERRQALRYRVALPAELDSNGTGQTRDISVSGVFFETGRSFSLGAPIRLFLIFEGGVRLQCEGQVVRVERSEEKTGVAVVLTSYRFHGSAQPRQQEGAIDGSEQTGPSVCNDSEPGRAVGSNVRVPGEAPHESCPRG
jgi:PilZ domain-containing protein